MHYVSPNGRTLSVQISAQRVRIYAHMLCTHSTHSTYTRGEARKVIHYAAIFSQIKSGFSLEVFKGDLRLSEDRHKESYSTIELNFRRHYP